MGTPQPSDEHIAVGLAVSRSRLRKFLSKSPADMLTSLRWNLRNLTRETVARLRFNLVMFGLEFIANRSVKHEH